jgi:hypothetical protein
VEVVSIVCHLFFFLKIFLSDMSITGHILKTAVFWDVSPCSLMYGLGGTFSLYLQGKNRAQLLSRSALHQLASDSETQFSLSVMYMDAGRSPTQFSLIYI